MIAQPHNTEGFGQIVPSGGALLNEAQSPMGTGVSSSESASPCETRRKLGSDDPAGAADHGSEIGSESLPKDVDSGANHVVYLAYGRHDELLYVGLSLRFSERVSQHKDDKSWFRDIDRVRLLHCDSREHAHELERRLIQEREPLYNVQRFEGPACNPAGPRHDGCGVSLEWVEWGSTEPWAHDSRWFKGAWFCRECGDYDPSEAPPEYAEVTMPLEAM